MVVYVGTLRHFTHVVTSYAFAPFTHRTRVITRFARCGTPHDFTLQLVGRLPLRCVCGYPRLILTRLHGRSPVCCRDTHRYPLRSVAHGYTRCTRTVTLRLPAHGFPHVTRLRCVPVLILRLVTLRLRCVGCVARCWVLRVDFRLRYLRYDCLEHVTRLQLRSFGHARVTLQITVAAVYSCTFGGLPARARTILRWFAVTRCTRVCYGAFAFTIYTRLRLLRVTFG